jgi:hypothetical protein
MLPYFWSRRQPSRHIIISGTGRAGTTLLVQYFTALGMDTGYSLKEAVTQVDAISQAGLERTFGQKDLPHIIKSPWLADTLSEVLKERSVELEAAIVPVRDLFEAAEGRRRVYREVEKLGRDPTKHPGTIWKTRRPEEQELYLGLQFYKLIEPLVLHKVPIFFLHFPEFARDHDVLYAALEPLLSRYGITGSLSWRIQPRLQAITHSSLSFFEREMKNCV